MVDSNIKKTLTSTPGVKDALGNLFRFLPKEQDQRMKWLASILNAIHDSVVVVDLDSTIIYVNPAYMRSLGVSEEKVLGRKLKDFEPTSRILDVLSSGKPIVDDPSRITSLGIDIMANITPVFEGKNLIGAVAVFRDISEIVALKEKLEETTTEMLKTREQTSRYYTELQELRTRLMDIDNLICESAEMRRVIEMVLRVGRVDSTVLVTGESGVGKEVVAKLLHKVSKRKDGPFVIINCGAVPENLLESELFGYEKGSFTGASKEGKLGLLELANKGTLFLDEIGELPLGLQVKLLRVLQDKKFTRLGGIKSIEVDVRFIAATNRDLKKMVTQKIFREDLFYRLNVVPIHIPPLHERRADIVPLAGFFLEKYNTKYGMNKRLLPEVLRWLNNFPWPGNVRELENVVERLVVSSLNDTITLKEVYLAGCSDRPTFQSEEVFGLNVMDLHQAKDMLEKEFITKALNLAGSARKAAQLLGINHSTVVRKARKYGINLA
ncbi:sigma-54 interaction domain-containing protein [Desulfoscipio gibsoniae]|uniref:HTH-type transcriptional regulatory protein TyrR n=1 Tax=Desulfoscipio gibsoniae DSM 7213 TaxID=767817 RepID=R4KG50_9FIRM|nr:sigma 54-interacting transcriptional regulator [Desulfoscipio gibsoniae]AGL00642.1 PAS domain S-box [Desulfoscipio gibsoniae DSM 7213]